MRARRRRQLLVTNMSTTVIQSANAILYELKNKTTLELCEIERNANKQLARIGPSVSIQFITLVLFNVCIKRKNKELHTT